MKHLLFLTFVLSSFVAVSRPLTIMNESNVSFDIIIWKDSKIIFHNIMKPNDELTIDNIGYGLLLQFNFVDEIILDAVSLNKGTCNHWRKLPNGYLELDLNDRHFDQHLRWWQPFVKIFSLAFHIEIIHPRA